MKRLLLAVLIYGFFLSILSCEEEERGSSAPFLIFRTGGDFITGGASVPVGGTMKFGISASGGGGVITDFRVRKINQYGAITLLDKGMWLDSGGFDTVLIYNKDTVATERWEFFIMTDTRDTAMISMDIHKGGGSAYGSIYYYPSITIGYPGNTQYPHFLDLNSGQAYSSASVSGSEHLVDLLSFFYFSSGKPSPTLSCPSYTSVVGYYPEINSWPVKNSTTYDYYSVDHDLVTPSQFFAATNDSLLINAYNASQVSGLCKFCNTGKVVPFKTSNARIGLIYMLRADENTDGSMEIAVKIQQ